MQSDKVKWVRLSELEVPEMFLPELWISECPFCGRELPEDYEVKANKRLICPYCSMVLMEAGSDEDIIQLMGGRKSIRNALEHLQRHPEYYLDGYSSGG